MKEILTSPEVIAAFVAALLGTLGGQFAQLKFEDYIFKKRRLREIRVTINTTAANLFRAIRPYISSANVVIMYTAQMNVVEANETEEQVSDRKIFWGSLIAEMNPSVGEAYTKLSEYESTLIAAAYECEPFLKPLDYNQLLRFVRIITNLTVRDWALIDYASMSSAEIQTAYETRLLQSLADKITQTDREYERIANELNTILK